MPLELTRPSGFTNFPVQLAGIIRDGPYRALVDVIHDGDTFHAIIDLGFGVLTYQAIRVQGCNAPELSTPEGRAALTFARTIIPSGTMVALIIERDFVQSFTRFVARVILPDLSDFAQVMIQNGHAVPELAL